MSLRRLFKRIAKLIALLAIFAILCLTLLFALLYHEHSTPMTLPAPSGHFPVGRAQFAWTNPPENDDLAPSPGVKRIVLVWIWYPAAPNAKSAPPAEYLPPDWQAAQANHSGVLITKFLTRDLSLVRTHSLSNAEVSPEQASYPVVILRAGGGALTTDFTTLAEDLASHGYFVVGFDAPYRTFSVVLPDNRVVDRPIQNDPENLPSAEANQLINRLLAMWVGDTKFVVDQLQQLNNSDRSGRFRGRLDLQRLGMFGHSFGGAQALQFCHDDSRCKAGIDLDGAPYGSVVRDGLRQPLLFIFSDHTGLQSDPGDAQVYADFHSIYDRLPNGRLAITIRGANHFSFSDQILLKSQHILWLMEKLKLGNLDGRRGLAITSDYVHTFFDVYLNGAPASQLAEVAKRYPEAQVQ